MNNKRNAGRKPVIYPEEQIYKIINECKKELKIKGVLKYSVIYKYALEKFNQNEYSFLKNKLSEDYWRKPHRQGRQLVDKVNKISDKNSTSNQNTNFNLINTEEAVYKILGETGNNNNKQRLVNILKANEINAKKLNERVSNLEKMLEKERSLKDSYKKKAEILQTAIFQLVENSNVSDFPIENLITTGKSRSKKVDLLLENIFSNNPFDLINIENYKNENTNNNKITSIKKRSASDDFGLL